MSETVVYGIHAVAALLNNPHRVIRKLVLNETREDKAVISLLETARRRHIPVERLAIEKMTEQFGKGVHQGVVAVAEPVKEFNEHDLLSLLSLSKKPALILILDGITDPHNLGACLRSADGAGVDFVIIPKDKNAAITPVVSKVASGALEAVPLVRATNLARAMNTLKQAGVWIYGAAGDAQKTIYEFKFQDATALVLGAEGKGMRRLTREHCDDLFALPMLGTVSSLNVSVAAGISLYEVVRQRNQ